MNYAICVRYYRVCCTLLRMFQARGYWVQKSALPIDLDDFVLMMESVNGNMFDFRVRKSEKEWLKVCFPKAAKTGVRDMRDIVQSATDDGIHHIVLVLKRKITPFANNRLSEHKDIHIEKFNTLDLCRDITQHSLVPPHRILSKTEVAITLQQLKIKSTSLFNAIQLTDPICKFFDARVGQVFEIRRTSPEGHRYLAYRVVVTPPKYK